MVRRVQRECAHDFYAFRYVARSGTILGIYPRIRRQHNRLPSEFGKVLGEFQTAMHGTTTAPRGIVKYHHQDLLHACSRKERTFFSHCCGDVLHIFFNNALGDALINPFINGPLRQFFGMISLSFGWSVSTMLNASSMIDKARSISRLAMMRGGMILITGS